MFIAALDVFVASSGKKNNLSEQSRKMFQLTR